MTSATNRWAFTAVDASSTEVSMRANLVLNWFPGSLLAPFLKLAIGKVLKEALEELKYYVETGEPHPRKLKANKA